MRLREFIPYSTIVSTVVLGSQSTWPILGPGYPPPKYLSSRESPAVQSWSEAIATIQAYLNGSRQLPGQQNLSSHTFSIIAFSALDTETQNNLQFHHTSLVTRNASLGTREVDGNSLYRIGSVSKVFTVYLSLLKLGSAGWDRPLTDFIPQLAAAAGDSEKNRIDNVDWSEVTLGALAGQMSGVTRGIIDIDVLYPGLTGVGFPDENYTDATANACFYGQTTGCTQAQWLQEIAKRPPTYIPWTTPIYSNAGYDLLAIALEKATGKTFADLINEEIVQPLNLTSVGFGVPQDVENVVGVGSDLFTWNSFTGHETAAAGFYSSIVDMAKLGVSIMNSSLLSSMETRKWLKPIAHSSSLESSVGRPWEILRFTQPRTQRVNDLYTKIGDVLNYDSELVLSPDHGAGFAVLTAGTTNGVVRSYLCDIITNAFLPGLEDAAAVEAERNFAGTYKASCDTVGAGPLNSSISFRVDPDNGPGLIIDSWINNGSSTLEVLNKAFGANDWRLYPTNLDENVVESVGGVARKQAFRATIAFDPIAELGVFSRAENQGTWLSVDGAVYRHRSLDSFVFELDASGRAVAVTPSAFRVPLQRI